MMSLLTILGGSQSPGFGLGQPTLIKLRGRTKKPLITPILSSRVCSLDRRMFRGTTRATRLAFFLQLPTLVCVTTHAARIAVIGGGISGTFASRYLTDFDQGCNLESLHLYDPLPLGEYTNQEDRNRILGQGSRVATLKLHDGRLVELGASIISDKFQLVKEIALAGNLSLVPPFETGIKEPNMRTGFLLYGGNGRNLINTANMTAFWTKLTIALRYNLDVYLVNKAMQDFMKRFEVAQYQLMDHYNFFHKSPEEVWKSVGLDNAVKISLAEYCRRLWIPKQLQWWRKFLMYGQGSLQEELLDGINLVNYNQDISAINALSGIASYSVLSVPAYGIKGGNVKLISSAWEQAKRGHCSKCKNRCGAIRHVRERISTVVGGLEGFELFAENGSLLGKYDIVILATPLPMAQINFLMQSHVDKSVLQPMPLGKLIEAEEDSIIPEGHEGHAEFPRSLSPSVMRPYTQVVTTVVRNGTLQTGFFSITGDLIPRGIYMTSEGKASAFNVTAISQISAQEGIYKIFSSEHLPHEALALFLGPNVYVEFEKRWDGSHGGATPDYRGNGESTEFLLFDGAAGFHGHTKSGAMYYPNALEHTLACVETSAMGAKAVAKLIAKRLTWITSKPTGFGFSDEL